MSTGLLTQKQIAERLGVSRQLVSFALRGQGRMSDQVRQQILELAQHNGYGQYSNREARAMVSRRYGKRAASGILAVVFKTTFEDQPVTSLPYFTAFFEGLEAEAIARGFDLALCAQRPHALPRLVREGQVDGVVGLLTPKETSVDINRLSLPQVNVMYAAPGGVSLIIDDTAGSALATRHLLELGHRRIAYIGVKAAKGRERLEGYQRALREYSVSYEAALVEMSEGQPSMKTGTLVMQEWLAQHALTKHELPFSAVVCYNDSIAMGVIRVLQESGWRVPEDISVAGFDDISLQHGFSPSLTSVSFPRQEMGRRAIELLCEQIENSEQSTLNTVEAFPVRMEVRDSTAPLMRKYREGSGN